MWQLPLSVAPAFLAWYCAAASLYDPADFVVMYAAGQERATRRDAGTGSPGGARGVDEPAWTWAHADMAAALTYAAVNAVTIYVFLFRSFSWPDGSIARFMW